MRQVQQFQVAKARISAGSRQRGGSSQGPTSQISMAWVGAMAAIAGLVFSSTPNLVAALERIQLPTIAHSAAAPAAKPVASARAFHRVDASTLSVVNKAAGITGIVRSAGLTVRTSPTSPQVSVTSTSLGRTGTTTSLAATAAATATDLTATIPRGPATEWFQNQEATLEQGWTIVKRPAGKGALHLDLAITGAAVHAVGARALSFVPKTGAPLVYDNLLVRDSLGHSLPAHFSLTGGGARIVVDDHAARYPIVVDPNLTAISTLDPTPIAGGNAFGDAVVTKGRWMVVGEQSARLSSTPTITSGRVNVFFDTTGNGTWNLVKSLTVASGSPYTVGSANTGLGSVVGLTVEPAGVTVFARLASQQVVLAWTFAGDPVTAAPFANPNYLQAIGITQWTLPTFSGVGGFATSFDAGNDGTLVVGAPLSGGQGVTGFKSATTQGPINEDIGTVEIFHRSGGFGTTYGYVTHVDPAGAINLPAAQRDAEQFFGTSVTYDPSTQVIAVGAPGDDGVRTDDSIYSTWPNGSTGFNGAVDVFTPSGTNTWSLAQRVTSTGSPAGAKFGNSLAFAGPSDGLVVGAPVEAVGSVGGNGAAYVIDHTGGSWNQVQRISADDPTTTTNETTVANMSAGTAVAASPDGQRIYVGVPGLVRSASTNTQGEVMVWNRSSETGAATYLTHLEGQNPNDAHSGIAESFGSVLSVSPTTAAVGVPTFGDPTATFAGRVSTFSISGSTYTPTGELAPASRSFGDVFGWTIAQDGDVMAVAQTGSYSGSGYGIGAVGLYDRTGSGWTLEKTMFPDALNYTASVGTTFDGGYGFALALHVYRDSNGHDTGVALAIGTPGASVVNPGGVGVDAAVSIPQTGNVGIWTRNGGPGTAFTHNELFAGSQEQTAANPGSTANAVANAHFGWSVAFTGDGSLLVGEPGSDSSFGGFIERYEGVPNGAASWTHKETIAAPAGAFSFGMTIKTDGNQVVTVSAGPGAGHYPLVSRFLDGNASTNLTPETSFQAGLDAAYDDTSLAISGNHIAVGSPSTNPFSSPSCTGCTEKVAIYRMVGNVPVREALLTSAPGDLGQDPRFGHSLDFNHGGSVTTLAVGADGADPTTTGQAFVYVAKTKSDGSSTWSRAATLVPTDALPGTPLIHTGTYRTGYGAAISNWPNNGGVQVSAPDATTGGALTGRLYAFDVSSVQPPPGPQAFVDVSLPPTVQVGADKLKTASLSPSLLSNASATDGAIAAAPIGSIDLSQAPKGTAVSASPIGSIPIGSIPIGSIPIGSIPLSSVPLSGVPGGWESVLAGSAFDGQPLQSVLLSQVLDLPSVKTLPLGALTLAGSPLASVPIGSIALGDTALKDLPLDPSSSTAALAQWCTALTNAKADTSALGLDCSNPTGSSNNAATVLSIGLKGAPIGSIPIGSIPIGSIPIGSIPIGSIPIGSITLQGNPIGSIPIGSIPIGSIPIGSIPIGSIPIGSIPIGSIPIGSIPLGGTPIGSIPIGSIDINSTPIGSIPIGSIPIGSIPIGSIPIGSIPIGSIPIGSIPIGSIPIGSIPIGSIPLSGIKVNSTPIGSIPIGSIPIGSIPIGSIPIGSIPLSSIPIGSIPIGSIPIGSIPIGSIPIGSIDLAGTPIGSIPIGSIPVSVRSHVVDCADGFDCTGKLLKDAAAAGALTTTGVLSDLSGLLTGARLSDLIGAGNNITADQLRTALGNRTLADFSGWDNLTIGELSAIWPYLTLDQIKAELGGVRLGDVANNLLDYTPGQVSDAVAHSSLTLADIHGWDNVTLGEVSVFGQYLHLSDLTPAMGHVRLGDLANAIQKPGGGTYSEADLRDALNQALPGAKLSDLSNFGDLTLGELGTYGDTTLAQLLSSLTGNAANGITFGDVLLALLNPKQYPWQALDLSQVATQALDDSPTGSPVTLAYRADAPDGLPRTVRVTVQLPAGARLDQSTIAGDGTAAERTPVIDGNTATWTFDNVPAGAPRSLTFQMDAPLTIGPASVKATAFLVADDAATSDTASTVVQESFEPNDTIAQATPLADDTIQLSHISHAGDIDVYKFDVTQPGTRVSISLSNLDADLDAVLYAPRDGTIVPTAGKSIDPVQDGGGSGLPAAQQAGTVTPQPEIGNDVEKPADLGSLAVVQGSFNRGRANEQIDTGVLTKTGTYYLAVSGYNAAVNKQPYALRLKRFVSNTQPSCPARSVTPGTPGTELPASLPSGTNTVFVVNQSRMTGLYGADATTTLMSQLHAFVTWLNGSGLGEQASVLTVDADQQVRDAYAQWDASPCLPSGANGVVSQIARILNGYRSNGATVKNVVLVGGDDAVPFARVPDRTTVANETGFDTFNDQGNALYATFATSSVQTDNAYVDRSPYAFGDRTLYVPDATIGRLVESPTEIGAQLTDFENADGKLAVHTGLVTGYDFLTDGAQGVANAVGHTYGSVDSSLISDSWTRQDLENAIHNIKPNLLSINAHFNNYQALPGAGNTTHDETDLFQSAAVRGALNGDLAGSIVFSMGCHSGLSASDLLVGASDPRALDFAQAVSSQGGVFVGNTGFGYGDTDTVALSEQLMGDFAQRLNGSMSVGEALLYAKNAYFSGLAEYTPYDEKVLQETTFYGLPFYQLDVPNPPAVPAPVSPVVTPDQSTGLDSTTTHLAPTYKTVTADNGTTYTAAVDPATGQDSLTTVQGRPVEPKVDQEFALPAGDQAHDALVLGLTSVDTPETDPYVFQPVVDNSGERVDVGVDTAFPTRAVQVNPGLDPAGQTFHVAATTGYFRTTDADGNGLQRTYKSMDVETFLPPAGTTDFTAPTFSQVTGQVHNGMLSVDAHAMDDQGTASRVKRVRLLLLEDPRAGVATTWRGLDLVRTADTDEWTGSLPTSGRNLEFVLQAVDAAGNVGVTTDKADNFSNDNIAGAANDGGADGGPVGNLNVTLSGPLGGENWYTGPVTVTATGGTKLVYEVVGESDPAGYQQPFQITGTGMHIVRVTSGDGQTQTVTIPIDTVGPVAQLTSPAVGQSMPAAPGALINYSCPDAGSGPTTCTAKLDGNSVTSGTTVPLVPGTHTVVVTAGPDRAGNPASQPTLTRTFTVYGAPATIGTIGVTKTQDGTPTTLTVPFNGYSVLTYSGTITWGDGATTNCAMAGSGCSVTRNASGGGTVTASHTYNAAAVDTTASVTVIDNLGQTATATVKVNRKTTLTATAALLQLQVSTNIVVLKSGAISATLKDGNGVPLAGQTIAFTLPTGATLCTATTNASGVAGCPSNLVYTVLMILAGHYNATFLGKDVYKGSTASASLIG